MKSSPKDYIFQQSKSPKKVKTKTKVKEVMPLPPKRGRPSKVFVRLEYLNPGERFEFQNLTMYRNLYVKRSSESSVSIGGEVYDELEKTWTRLPPAYHVAPSCQVRAL